MKSGVGKYLRLPLLALVLTLCAVTLQPVQTAGQTGAMISEVEPSVLAPGENALLLFSGEGFMPGCELRFSPPVIAGGEPLVIGPDTMEMEVNVSPSASPGPVAITYLFNGISSTFQGLLEIAGQPRITSVSPDTLSGPEDSQLVEVNGVFFSPEWASDLMVSAQLISAGVGNPLSTLVSFESDSLLSIEMDTPHEYYADPCVLSLELTDGWSGATQRYDIPVDVEPPPPAEPEITGVTLRADASLELGDFPAATAFSLRVDGRNLGALDPTSLRITSFAASHLEHAPTSSLHLENIVVRDDRVTADLSLEVLGDDRSFAPASEVEAGLRIGGEDFAADCSLGLAWPDPLLQSLAITVDGEIRGSIVGGEIALSGDPVFVTARLEGDYIRPLTGTALSLTCGEAVFTFDYTPAYSSDTSFVEYEIELSCTSLTAEMDAAQFDLDLHMGDGQISGSFEVPVELTEVAPVVRIDSADFIPAAPLVQPGTDSGQLRVTFSGENLDLLTFDADTVSLAPADPRLTLSVDGLDSLNIGPSTVVAVYSVAVDAPEAHETPLASGAATAGFAVGYQVALRYEEFSDDLAATFFADSAATLSLSYPPAFESVEIMSGPDPLAGDQYIVSFFVVGENLLPSYVSNAEAQVSAQTSGEQNPELVSFAVNAVEVGHLGCSAVFDVGPLLEDSVATRGVEFVLELSNPDVGLDLASDVFSTLIGNPPVFTGLEVVHPALDELVERSFEVEFTVSGRNLAEEYLDNAFVGLALADQSLRETLEVGPLEINSITPELVEATVPVYASTYDPTGPQEAMLYFRPDLPVPTTLEADFVLDIVIEPKVSTVRAYTDDELALGEVSEFLVEFDITGEHFRPEYFESLVFDLQPGSPGVEIACQSPEIEGMTPSRVSGWFMAELPPDFMSDSDELPLRMTANAPGLTLPAVQLMLHLIPPDVGPTTTVPGGLMLMVDDSQRLYVHTRDGGLEDDMVRVELELEVQFISDEGPVRNIRGLTFDDDLAADAFRLAVGGEEFEPRSVRRRAEDLLKLQFDVPLSALGSGGTTRAELVTEPEDLAFAFEPILGSDQRTLEFDLSLQGGTSGDVAEDDTVVPEVPVVDPPAEEYEYRSIDLIVAASGLRCYTVEDVELDYAIPLSRRPGPEADHIGPYNFSAQPARGFGGTVQLGSSEAEYTVDAEAGSVQFGDGLTGARIPTGDFEQSDVPEMTIGAGASTGPVYLFPLFNTYSDPQLAIGVALSPDARWSPGYEQVGEPMVLELEPWSDYGTSPQPQAPGSCESLLNLELVSPYEPGQIVNGDLLWLEFDWTLASNINLVQTGDWTFSGDPTVVAGRMVPVQVKDSDAEAGNLVRAGGSDDAGSNANWDFGGMSILTGQLRQHDLVVGDYEIELRLDGSAFLSADLSDLETNSPFELDLPVPKSEPMGIGESPFYPGEEWPDDPGLRMALATMFVGLHWPLYGFYGGDSSKVDCSAAVEELRRLREEAPQCDCSDEEEALHKATQAFFDAQAALNDAEQARQDADQAKEDADQAKEDADKAVEEAEQAEQDAQDELERYINEEVPGASAVSGSASEAGAHGYGAQHAGAFACGSNFVGTRIGNNAAWDAHRTEINSRWNAWRSAYRAAKKARKEAEAAAEAAEQAEADAEQAQADLEQAQEDFEAAEAAMDAAREAYDACMKACEEHKAAEDAAAAKVRECGLDPDNLDDDDAEGEEGDSGDGSGADTGTSTAPGGADSEGDGLGDGADSGDSGGGGVGGGGNGASPNGGGNAGPGGGGNQGSSTQRPPGGWPWEQPPPSETGDEELDELIKMFEKIAELIDEWERAKKDFEENDLVSEVRLYESIADLLDNIDELDDEVSNALEEFAKCNSEPLEELLAKGGDKIDAVVAALGLLKGVIGIYLIVDEDIPASRRAKLEAIKDKLDKAIDKLEELKEKGEDASELAATLAAIKEGEIWPEDIIDWLGDKLSEMLSEAAKDAAEKVVKKALEKVFGSKAAGPIYSILKDLVDFGDALGSKWEMDDLDEAITKALKEAIAKADGMEQYHIPCEWEYLSGKYVWIAGDPDDWEDTEVKFKWEKRCLCDGKWQTFTCDAGEPTVEDKDGRRYWTFPQVNLPKTSCNPCIITVQVSIKRGSTTVTHNLLVGVQVCK